MKKSHEGDRQSSKTCSLTICDGCIVIIIIAWYMFDFDWEKSCIILALEASCGIFLSSNSSIYKFSQKPHLKTSKSARTTILKGGGVFKLPIFTSKCLGVSIYSLNIIKVSFFKYCREDIFNNFHISIPRKYQPSGDRFLCQN